MPLVYHSIEFILRFSLLYNWYDRPRLAPRMFFLFWWPGDFPVSYSNRDTSWNAWNRHSGSFMVVMGILFSKMKSPFTNVKWHSDPSPTVTSQPVRLPTNIMTLIPSLTFTELWVVPRSICMPARDAYPSVPVSVLACAPIVETRFLELAFTCLYSTFHLAYPLVLFRFCLTLTLFQPHTFPLHILVRNVMWVIVPDP